MGKGSKTKMNKNKYPEIPDNARLSDMLLLANVFSKTMSQELKNYDEQIEKMEFQAGMKELGMLVKKNMLILKKTYSLISREQVNLLILLLIKY